MDFHKDTSHTSLVPTSFELDYLYKNPISKYILSFWGRGVHNSTYNRSFPLLLKPHLYLHWNIPDRMGSKVEIFALLKLLVDSGKQNIAENL